MPPRTRFLNRSPFVQKPVETGSRRRLLAELDRLTSLLVRRHDRRCVTCGCGRNLQCSHFYSRRHLATRFDLRNCNAMCADCNRRHNSDPSPYLRFMNERHGPDVVEELQEVMAQRRKVTDEEPGEALGRLKDLAQVPTAVGAVPSETLPGRMVLHEPIRPEVPPVTSSQFKRLRGATTKSEGTFVPWRWAIPLTAKWAEQPIAARPSYYKIRWKLLPVD